METTQIGHYDIVGQLGSGGMGVVWKARHRDLGTMVALKTMPAGFQSIPVLIERFRREAQVMARLRHPHIVQVSDFGDENEVYYLVMEFIDGETLSVRVREKGPMAPDEALRILEAVADGADFAHKQGVIHRDLKPSNVLLARDGTVKVTDFGLARILEGMVRTEGGKLRTASEAASLGRQDTSPAGLSVSGQILGTLEYMSPEQRAGGAIDARADVYSMAVIAFEILIGRLPRGIEYPHELRPDLPPAVTQVIHRALGAPDRRPAGCLQFVQELRDALKPVRRRRLWPVALAAALILAGGAVWKFYPRTEPPVVLAPKPEVKPEPERPPPPEFRVTADVHPAGAGSVNHSGDTLTATAAAGFAFEKWSDGLTSSVRRIESDLLVTALFQRSRYVVRARSEPPSGGNVEPVQQDIEYDGKAAVTAAAAAGFEFDGWADDSAAPPQRTVTVREARELVARFREIRFRLTTSASAGGSVEAEPAGGSHARGAVVKLTAKADPGFEFAGWDDGNSDSVRDVTMTADVSRSATFVRRRVTVAVSADPPEGGTVTGAGTAEHGATVTLKAQPALGFGFSGWKDGASEPERRETVTADRQFTAIFKDAARAFEGHTDTIWAIDFSPDGRYVVSGGEDHVVRVWDLHDGAIEVEYKEHKYLPVTVLAVSADGKYVASGGKERDVQTWELKTGKRYRTVYPHGEVTAVTWAKGNEQVATGAVTKLVGVWNIANPLANNRNPDITMGELEFEINTLALNSDGTTMAVGVGDGGIRLYSVDWTAFGTWAMETEIIAPAGKGRGTFLAWTTDGLAARWVKDPTKVAVWKSGAWKEPARMLEGHASKITSLSARGDWVAAGAEDGTVRVWNSRTESLRGIIRGPKGAVHAVKISADASQLATGGADKILRVVPLN